MRRIAATCLLLIWLPGMASAGVLFMDGFETGDTGIWAGSGSTTGWTVQTTTVHGGNYAVSGSVSAATPSLTLDSFHFSGQTEAWYRFYIYLTGLSANISINQIDVASFGSLQIQLVTDGSSRASLGVWNSGTNAQVGSSYSIPQNQWLRVEVHNKINASTGTAELLVNGVTAVSSVGNLNTGSTNIIEAFLQLAGSVSMTGTVYFDDAIVNNTGFPGVGSIIVRQCNTATPTDNNWSLSTGSNIWNVWDDTPADSHDAFNSQSGQTQTCGLSFNNTTDTGASGHGSGVITSGAGINGAAVAWLGKSASSGDTAQDSSIWFPNGGSETDTAGPVAYPGNTTSTWEETVVATPTAAQVLNLQTGIKHAANTFEHDVFGTWTMVDYAASSVSGNKGQGVFMP